MDSLYVANKFQSIQLKIDSFNNMLTLKEINFRLNDQHNLSNQVNSFYESAWLKLIIIITILGVVIPIIANYFQKKGFKDLTDFILTQIKDSHDNKIQELKTYNDTQLQSLTSKYIAELEELKNQNKNFGLEMDASLLYLQGKTLLLNTGGHLSAFVDFIRASEKWLISKKPERAKVTMVNAFIAIKKTISKAEFTGVDKIRNFDYAKSISNLKMNEHYEVIKDKIEAIELFISKLP